MAGVTSGREQAYTLLQFGRPADALDTLARDFDAADPWSWHLRAAALIALNRHEEAARAAEDGLSEHPEQPYLLDALAAARIGLDDFAGAEEAILGALRIDAENADFLTRYAHVVARVGQIEKAEKLVERALSLEPESDFALQMHALLATAGTDRAAAIARSRELLRHWPEHPLGHRLLGFGQADDRVDEAAEHARRAVQLDPYDEDAAELARELRQRSHWLMWPLRPLIKWGPAPVWIAAVATMFLLRALKLHGALSIVVVVWIVYCVYSWTVPHVVRRLTRRW